MSQGTLSGLYRHAVRADLFPWLEGEPGPPGERYRRLVAVLERVAVLELTRVESFVPRCHGLPGRPVEDRAAPACAFVAREVFDIATTRALIERLEVDGALRRLCGWTGAGEVSSEATF